MSGVTFIDTDVGRFHVLSWGDPDSTRVTLLLHGFNQTAHSWAEVGPALPGRVIAFDQRGHGDSMRSDDDVSRIVEALGVERLAVVGMSMGAVHATTFAAQHPQRVQALVVVDYAPEVETGGVDKIKLMLMRSWSNFDEEVTEVSMFNPKRSEANIRERLSHSLAQKEDGRWSWKVDTAFATESRFGEGAAPMWDNIRAVQCPTLVIRGADSDLLSADMAEKVCDALAAGTLVTIADAGHSVAGDNPKAFISAVAPFLAAEVAHEPPQRS